MTSSQIKTSTRHRAIRIALYNHKGGVGKTTLTANIAAELAFLGKKVLLVDSDPQCNLTSYFIEESVVDDLLDTSPTSKGRTLWTALRPIVEAEGNVNSLTPYEIPIGANNTTSLYLLPGDIRLAEYETDLNTFWRECLERRIPGYRGTSSLSTIVNECASSLDCDYVFYDTGPNIGPLNRNIMLDCDYFIIPVACDLFSMRALKSLGNTMVRWIQDWNIILSLAPSDTYLMPGVPKYLGYIPQRFKMYGGQITAASAEAIPKIDRIISSDIIAVLRKIDTTLAAKSVSGTRLGEVKDFSSLVQKSQHQGVPLSEVFSGIDYQKEDAKKAFMKIAEKIIKKTSGK